MKRRISILLALMALALMLGASAPTMACSLGKVTGFIRTTVELYNPDMEIVWARARFAFHVREVEPWVDTDGQTHNARGWYRLRTYHEEIGQYKAHIDVSCVQFGEEDGVPFALFSGKIDSVSGLDPSIVGTYWVLHVYDGGTPGSEGDLYSYYIGDARPGWSYDALCNVPAGQPDYSTGWHLEYPVEGGNLVIRH